MNETSTYVIRKKTPTYFGLFVVLGQEGCKERSIRAVTTWLF